MAVQSDYLIVDVFTDKVFGGNQLAVVPDARGLSPQAMQAVAREFNFAESSFVLPPANPGDPTRVRIFTPKTELRFAGHPTVGTAAALAHLGLLELQDGIGRIVLMEQVGPVRVEVDARAVPIFARLTLPGEVEMPTRQPDCDAVAAALSLPRSAMLDCWFASVGIPFCMVHLADAGAVDGAVLDRAAWDASLRRSWAPQLFLFAGELTAGGRIHARMFAPGFGIDEDPATGSASATLAGCIAARSEAPNLSVALTIVQGVLMGRPSTIHASAEKRDGKVREVAVGGRTAIFATGTITVPL